MFISANDMLMLMISVETPSVDFSTPTIGADPTAVTIKSSSGPSKQPAAVYVESVLTIL